jgi:hypothetical protein
MKDTAGNEIQQINPNCDCQSTGGCEKCRPNIRNKYPINTFKRGTKNMSAPRLEHIIMCEHHGRQAVNEYGKCPLCEQVEYKGLTTQPACFYCGGKGCINCKIS